MSLFNRKPDYSEFGLPDVPEELPIVWISNQGRPWEPILLEDLFGIGNAWVVGWLAPSVSNSNLPDGIKLYFNGQPIVPRVEGLVPEEDPDFFGAVQVATKLMLLANSSSMINSQ